MNVAMLKEQFVYVDKYLMRSFVYLQYYPEMEVATKEQEGEKAAKEREKQGRKGGQMDRPNDPRERRRKLQRPFWL